MRVLLTRPQEESRALAQRLEALGVESLIDPMLVIRPLDTPLALAGVQAIAVTSANGARALARVWPHEAVRPPVFAVGPASAQAAGEAGFTVAGEAAGDAAALATLIGSRLDPKAGAVLHVCGRDLAGDLAGRLEAQGFTVERAVLYVAEAAQSLAPATQAALAQGALDAVLLYSPRTAATFAALVQEAGLAEACRSLRALCLSANVAAAATLPFRVAAVAAAPSEDALIALLGG